MAAQRRDGHRKRFSRHCHSRQARFYWQVFERRTSLPPHLPADRRRGILMLMPKPLARVVSMHFVGDSPEVINPYQSPRGEISTPNLLRRLLNSGFVNEFDLGVPIGGILTGELWGFTFGEVRDGLDIFLYGDWGYVYGSTLGGIVGLAFVVRRCVLRRRIAKRRLARRQLSKRQLSTTA